MQDIIERIKAAERRADEEKSRAAEDAHAMISQAEKDGRRLVDEAIKAAGVRAETIKKQAEERSEEIGRAHV